MEIQKIRDLLRKYNFEHSIVVNKKSKRCSIILDNNVIDTGVYGKKMVIFRPLPDGKNTFCMERDRFYAEFEEVFDNDKAIELVGKYLSTVDDKSI